MELVTRNALKHVYEALQARKRQADRGNISNLQLFYNRVMSEYCASEKSRSQSSVIPLTGQDVDNFYARKMTREIFVEVVRIKVRIDSLHSQLAPLLCMTAIFTSVTTGCL